MNSQNVAAWVMAGVMLVTMLGGLLALTLNIGTLKGQITSFMATSERDRADVLKDIGRLEERQDRHIEIYHGGHK